MRVYLPIVPGRRTKSSITVPAPKRRSSLRRRTLWTPRRAAAVFTTLPRGHPPPRQWATMRAPLGASTTNLVKVTPWLATRPLNTTIGNGTSHGVGCRAEAGETATVRQVVCVTPRSSVTRSPIAYVPGADGVQVAVDPVPSPNQPLPCRSQCWLMFSPVEVDVKTIGWPATGAAGEYVNEADGSGGAGGAGAGETLTAAKK